MKQAIFKFIKDLTLGGTHEARKETQMQTIQEPFNEIWHLDEARSERWEKPILVTTIGKLEQEGLYDPWYDEIPNSPTFWYDSNERDRVSCITHKSKSPTGIPVGLVVMNKVEFE